jgi:serine/threonine-protein kinase mTOR
MKEDFLDSAEQILSFRQHRDGLVRRMVITLIPTLAVYDTQTFSEHYLHKAMGHLLTQLEKPNERSFGVLLSPLQWFHSYFAQRSLPLDTLPRPLGAR